MANEIIWPQHSPKPLSDPLFRAGVGRWVRHPSPNTTDLINLARQAVAQHVDGKDFASSVQAYLDLCYTVDDVKIATVGRDASPEISNRIMQILSLLVGERLADAKEEQFDTLEDLYDLLRETPTPRQAWFWYKLFMLVNNMKRARQMRRFVRGFQIDHASRAYDLCQQALPDLTGAAHELAARIMELRKYGVKTSFFEDGLLHGPGEAWVFSDFGLIRKTDPIAVAGMVRGQIAMVALAQKATISGGVPDLQRIQFASTLHPGLGGGVTDFGFDGRIGATIDSKGELDASIGFGLLMLRDEFKRTGKEVVYEVLRLMHLLHLHDLVTPVTTVAKVPELPTGPVLGGLGGFLQRKLRELPIIPDFLVPRIRRLEDPDLVQELEREIEQAEEATKRTLRRHTVEWHARQLPKGHHPSARAKALAQKEGYALEEGETFVQTHKRGNGPGAIEMHRGVHR